MLPHLASKGCNQLHSAAATFNALPPRTHTHILFTTVKRSLGRFANYLCPRPLVFSHLHPTKSSGLLLKLVLNQVYRLVEMAALPQLLPLAQTSTLL